MRIEDIDVARCRPEFRDALIEDLRWFGLEWDEGPFLQSERRALYLDAWRRLRERGAIYPCTCSRKDVLSAVLAPHDEHEEPIYPGTCRDAVVPAAVPGGSSIGSAGGDARSYNWRFRVPDDEQLSFTDQRLGLQTAIAGRDFGDFLVWRRDDVPAYQLAVVTDDAAMQISEVVRGGDLLTSTFRQLLLYRALGLQPPKFFHAPLIRDESGRRLAKRNASLSLRALRDSGATPDEIRSRFTASAPAS